MLCASIYIVCLYTWYCRVGIMYAELRIIHKHYILHIISSYKHGDYLEWWRWWWFDEDDDWCGIFNFCHVIYGEDVVGCGKKKRGGKNGEYMTFVGGLFIASFFFVVQEREESTLAMGWVENGWWLWGTPFFFFKWKAIEGLTESKNKKEQKLERGRGWEK